MKWLLFLTFFSFSNFLFSQEKENKDPLLTLDYVNIKVDSALKSIKNLQGTVASTSTILSITNGGTGADTAAGARANLGVPSLTGSGASGTWDINITGNAATATDDSKVLKTGDTMTGALLFDKSGEMIGVATGISGLVISTAVYIGTGANISTITPTGFYGNFYGDGTTLTGIVPYTGATSDINLGVYKLQAATLTINTNDILSGYPLNIFAPNSDNLARFDGSELYYSFGDSNGLEINKTNTTDSFILDVNTDGTYHRLYVAAGGNVGIGTNSPNYTLDVNGNVNANAFYGDGTNLTGTGDDLGNHTATQNLIMSGYKINNANKISVNTALEPQAGLFVHNSSITVQDNDSIYDAVTGINIRLTDLDTTLRAGGTITGDWSSERGNGLKITTHTYIVGIASITESVYAQSYYGDGSNLTGIAGDNLGDHTATQDLDLSGYNILNGNEISITTADVSGYINLTSTSGILNNGKNIIRVTNNGNVYVGDSGAALTVDGASTKNTFVGYHAGNNTTLSALYNTIIGYEAGQAITDGDFNTFIGVNAGNAANSDWNTMVGRMAGYHAETGGGNSYFGYGAGYYNHYGSNTGIGYNACRGDTDIYISSGVCVGAETRNYANGGMAFGYGTTNNSTNTANFGSYGIQTDSDVVANAFYGDGSNLTDVSGDNLGNHIATTTLDMADNFIDNIYYIRGSTENVYGLYQVLGLMGMPNYNYSQNSVQIVDNYPSLIFQSNGSGTQTIQFSSGSTTNYGFSISHVQSRENLEFIGDYSHGYIRPLTLNRNGKVIVGANSNTDELTSFISTLTVRGDAYFTSSMTVDGGYYGDGSNLTGVIQSTATGSYPLTAAKGDALTNDPTACLAGEYVTDMAADGTLTCSTPSGGGDAVLSATQTFTGENIFESKTQIYNDSSSDTYSLIVGTAANSGAYHLMVSTQGVVSIPKASRMRARASENQYISATTLTTVNFASEDYDTQNEFSGNRFTAKTDGFYYVASAITILADVANGNMYLRIYKNGVAQSQNVFNIYWDAYKYSANITDIVKLEVGDYIEIKVYFEVAKTIRGNVDYATYLAIHKLS